MNKNNSFYSWLSLKTKKEPPPSVDEKILAYSAQYFKPKGKSHFFTWKQLGAVVLASLVLIFVLINKYPSQVPGQPFMVESPEMILHYNEIELMADASTLTDEDWARINGHYAK